MMASAYTPTALNPLEKRVPDFFIVGQAKSGTTALYNTLRGHPQIYMPYLKEPQFLASDLRYRFWPPGIHRPPDTLEEYLSLFDAARPDQRAGEASTDYLWSRTAAGRIADLQPDARIIAILREPVSFLRSLHLHWVSHHVETEKDLRKALSLEEARREGKHIPPRSHRPQMLLYSDRVRYVEQLRRYHEFFPRERVLVLIYEDFRRDGEATVREVLRFLDVDDTSGLVVQEANQTVHVRALRLYELVHAVSLGRGPVSRRVKATVKALTARQLSRASAMAICNRILLTTNPPPPNESLTIELRRRFKGEVVALSEYLDRDLVTLWGYDNVN